MILPIYLYGHPVLRTPTEEVTPDYPDLRQLIANMRETMCASDGIGIAAPQVGLSLRLIYIDVDVLKGDMPELAGVHLTLINPQLTVDETVPVMTREEGCLSLPGIHENVPRHERVHLVWWDEDWQRHEQDFEGYLARVIQHEYDHIEQKVFTDRISAGRKLMVKSKLNNIARGNVRCDYRTRSAHSTRRD